LLASPPPPQRGAGLPHLGPPLRPRRQLHAHFRRRLLLAAQSPQLPSPRSASRPALAVLAPGLRVLIPNGSIPAASEPRRSQRAQRRKRKHISMLAPRSLRSPRSTYLLRLGL